MLQQVTPRLTAQIRAEIKQGDSASSDADKHYHKAGELLIQLKEENPGQYLKRLKNDVGISQQRASELMHLAGGKVTLKDLRESKRQSMTKAREKAKVPQRCGTPKREHWSPGCDYDPEDPNDVAEPGDTPEMVRQALYSTHISEALRHARGNGLTDAPALPSEITKANITAARSVVKAWNEVVRKLETRSKK